MSSFHPPDFEPVTLTGGQRIIAHPPSWCEDDEHCAVHNPSDHHMRDWPQHFRDPAIEAATFGLHPGLMERICPHGVGHPDPDHMAFYRKHHSPEEVSAEGMHGCDGCCMTADERADLFDVTPEQVRRGLLGWLRAKLGHWA